MKSRLLLLGLVLAVLPPISAFAWPAGPPHTRPLALNVPSVRLSPVLTTVTAIPNNAVIVTYTITNEGASGDPTDTYTVDFPTLPVGWAGTASPNPVATVVPGNSQNIDVRVNVPAGVIPGTYQIRVRVTAAPSGVTTEAQINVIVSNSTQRHYLPLIMVQSALVGGMTAQAVPAQAATRTGVIKEVSVDHKIGSGGV